MSGKERGIGSPEATILFGAERGGDEGADDAKARRVWLEEVL